MDYDSDDCEDIKEEGFEYPPGTLYEIIKLERMAEDKR